MDINGNTPTNSTPELTPVTAQAIYDTDGKPTEIFLTGDFYWTHVDFVYEETIRIVTDIDTVMSTAPQPATKNDLVAQLSSTWIDVGKVTDDYIAFRGCGTDYECFKNLYVPA